MKQVGASQVRMIGIGVGIFVGFSLTVGCLWTVVMVAL